MGFISKVKDPDAVLPYDWDFTAWLGADTIDSAEFIVTTAAGEVIPDTDLTPVEVDSSTTDDTTATAWLSGGTIDTTYLVTCRVITTAGMVDDRTMKLRIVQR